MNNFHFDVTCKGDEELQLALLLAFKTTGNEGPDYRPGLRRGATHYALREPKPAVVEPAYKAAAAKPLRLVFYAYGPGADLKDRPDLVALPFRLDAAGAADFARRWLAEADYGPQPDHDGDNEKGWRVYNESWGHVDDDGQAIVAVAPAWAMHGK